MVGGAYGVKRAPASKDPMTGPGGIICNRKKCFNYKVANDWQVLRQKLTSQLSAESGQNLSNHICRKLKTKN